MPLRNAKNTLVELLARRCAAAVALGLCVVLAPLTGCAQTKAPAAPIASPVAAESNGPVGAGISTMNAIGAFVEKRSELVLQALSLLGVNYKFGGNNPETGLDCSGLVRLVFNKTLGLVLPRRSEEMTQVSQEVPAQEIQPGDLVFFNTLRKTFSHVGIYIGNGQFVHAPSKGKTVRVESMNSQYWKTRFDGARRVEGSDRATGLTENFVRNLVERSDSNERAASAATQ